MGSTTAKMSTTPTRRPTVQIPNAPKRPHTCLRIGCGGAAHKAPSPIRTPPISAEDENYFLEQEEAGEDYSEEYLEPFYGEPPAQLRKRARTEK